MLTEVAEEKRKVVDILGSFQAREMDLNTPVIKKRV